MEHLSNVGSRAAVFFVGCLCTRAALAYFAKTSIDRTAVRGVLVAFAALSAGGWLRLWWFKLRMKAPEAGGGLTWWNNHRPVHALLYMLFAIAALMPRCRKHAWGFLAFDVLWALAWYLHRLIGFLR